MGKLLASLVLGFSWSFSLYAANCDSIDKTQHAALYAKCMEALKSSVVSTGVDMKGDSCDQIDPDKNPIQYEYCKNNKAENAQETAVDEQYNEAPTNANNAATLIHETSERIQPAVGKDLSTSPAATQVAPSATTVAPAVVPAATQASLKLAPQAEKAQNDCSQIDGVKHPALLEACKATESHTQPQNQVQPVKKAVVANPMDDECDQINKAANPRIYDACVRGRDENVPVKPVVVAKPADECQQVDKTKNPAMDETCTRPQGGPNKVKTHSQILVKDKVGCNHIDKTKDAELYNHCVASTQEDSIVEPTIPEEPKDTFSDCTRTRLKEIVCSEGTYVFTVEDEGEKAINDVLREVPSDIKSETKRPEIFVDPNANQFEVKPAQNVSQ